MSQTESHDDLIYDWNETKRRGPLTTRTIEFDDSDLHRLIRKIARAAGFRPVSHKIEVCGLCDACR